MVARRPGRPGPTERKHDGTDRWRRNSPHSLGSRFMATHPAVTPVSSAAPRELRIVSHSNLFYWWPVWLVGFLLGIVSLISNYQLAAVHRGTVEAKLESPDNVTVRQVIEVDPKTHEHKFASNT